MYSNSSSVDIEFCFRVRSMTRRRKGMVFVVCNVIVPSTVLLCTVAAAVMSDRLLIPLISELSSTGFIKNFLGTIEEGVPLALPYFVGGIVVMLVGMLVVAMSGKRVEETIHL